MLALIIVIAVVAAALLGLLVMLSLRRSHGTSLAERSGRAAPTKGRPTAAEIAAADQRAADERRRARGVPEEPAAELPVAGAPSGAPVELPTEAAEEPPRIRDRIGRTRGLFSGYLSSLRGRTGVDDSTWDDLEEALLLADAGVKTTTRVLDDLRIRAKAGELADSEAVIDSLKADLKGLFEGEDRELREGDAEPGSPTLWLFVGVNGVGKTTTIGKLAAREAGSGKKVVLAAGDTFRAAAGEQLETWAERSGSSIIRGSDGADPSSVIFDAVQHAAARGADIVLADTAGRLHTKVNLMDELRKVRRVAERPPAQLTEVLLVIDATTGQNGLAQAQQFTEAVGVTGVVLTKLDGTAKGGIVLAIRSELGLPIKLVGLGEHAEDLVPFDPDEFVEALFSGA